MKNDTHPLREIGAPATAPSGPRGKARRVPSDELFARGHELIIEHAGEEYRLRITSKGKLILTK